MGVGVLWCLLYGTFQMPLSVVLTSRQTVLQFKYLTTQGFYHARHLESSLWFVVAVLLCWVCVTLKLFLDFPNSQKANLFLVTIF